MRNKKVGKFTSILLCAMLLLSVVSVGMSSVEVKAATDGPQTPYTYRIASNNSNDKHFWYCFAEDADQPKLKVGDVYRFSYYYSVSENSQFPDSHGSNGSAYFSFKIGGRGSDDDWLKLDSFQATYSTSGIWKYEEYTWTVPKGYEGATIQRLRFTLKKPPVTDDYLKLTDIRFCKVTDGVAGANCFEGICQTPTFATGGVGSLAEGGWDVTKTAGKSQWWASDWSASFLIQETDLNEFKRPGCTVKDSEGNTLTTVANGQELDLSLLALPQRDGYWFAGYYTDAACTQPFANGTAISEDTTLYYGWVEASDFDILGVQVRLTGKEGLRFMCRAGTAMLEQLESLNAQEKSMHFGMLLQRLDKGNGNAFTRADVGTAVGLQDVPAKNFVQQDDYTYFNAVVIGIPDTHYATKIALRSYVTYTDASGIERTYYNAPYTSATLTDSDYAVASLATAAQATLAADEAETDPAKKLSDEARTRLNNIVSSVA